ncbi:MAG: hypothetical protein UX09_C0023G0003 [Candidatus Uhrbacteria bacterium GW2011_GWE2_45_35]|uniref:Uncharacterized protein n=2 Tax=Candidatus Uhriibacteriota TaxID=1752732 RepID=A0A0G1MFD3_9BACT|nr:MAG: hypothetical protein UW63_C0023G0003 [Candidatus Uhrbacteria bacterium GW2011_GWF2_44_350]KKU07863.1 MAG: hypothetical protein UX09_C0023G0003 [Candidatus Uhrbacteria bacterium GW2011_GWE2_45_35]HBR80536.1 hypothetical protein [Candidatus Uhrbacteria bacterium]HCU31696.1 hypothetical protein [Candidatus Uhrbacteria bacterium]
MSIPSEHGVALPETKVQSSFFEQEGIRHYAEQVRPVEQEDLENLQITPESLVHVVRHLVGISVEARAKLIGQTFDDDGVEQVIDESFLARQLETVGSKFHPVIVDPEKIIGFCLEKIRVLLDSGQVPVWIKNSISRCLFADFQIIVSHGEKTRLGIPEGNQLGNCALIKITPEIADRVTVEQRGYGQSVDNIKVNVVRGVEPPLTDVLVFTLKKSADDQPPVFHTAYTGILTVPLPRPSDQFPEELAYNQDWWSQYAFVK